MWLWGGWGVLREGGRTGFGRRGGGEAGPSVLEPEKVMLYLHARSLQDSWDAVGLETLLTPIQSLSANSHTRPVLEQNCQTSELAVCGMMERLSQRPDFKMVSFPSFSCVRLKPFQCWSSGRNGHVNWYLIETSFGPPTHQCCMSAGVKINLEKLGFCPLLRWEPGEVVGVTGKVCPEGGKGIGHPGRGYYWWRDVRVRVLKGEMEMSLVALQKWVSIHKWQTSLPCKLKFRRRLVSLVCEWRHYRSNSGNSLSHKNGHQDCFCPLPK